MENKEIEKAAQQYAHEYCDMLDLSHYKGLHQGFKAGARLRILQLNQLESELAQLKADNERLKAHISKLTHVIEQVMINQPIEATIEIKKALDNH